MAHHGDIKVKIKKAATSRVLRIRLKKKKQPCPEF
jgi:hypothetical protein